MGKNRIVENYMERLKRLVSRGRIHLGAFEECSGGLITYLREIISEKDISKIQKAKNTIAMYYYFIFTKCREKGLGYLLRELDLCRSKIDELLKNSEEYFFPAKIGLPAANWSVEQPIVGKIAIAPANVDFFSMGQDILISVRGGHIGTVIYLMKKRPTVGMLNNWPDQNSVIVTVGGGENSEEMNLARSKGMPYINGSWDYFADLCSLEGKIVTLLPTKTNL